MMMITSGGSRAGLLLVLGLWTGAIPLAAQALPDLRGERIRIGPLGVADPLTGTVESQSDDGLQFADSTGRMHRVTVDSIQSLDRSLGLHGQKGPGAAIGAGIGLAGGLAIGAHVNNTICGSCSTTGIGGLTTVLGPAAVGVVVGAFVGAIVGSQVTRERWDPILPTPSGIGAATVWLSPRGTRGVALGVVVPTG